MNLDPKVLVESGEGRIRYQVLDTIKVLVKQLHEDGRTRERAKGAVAELQGKLYLLLKSKRLEDQITTIIYDQYRSKSGAK